MTCRAANTPKPAAASRQLRQRHPRSGSRGGVPWGRPFLWETQQLGWGLSMARSKRAIRVEVRPAVAAELPLTSQTLPNVVQAIIILPLWSYGRTNHNTTQHCPTLGTGHAPGPPGVGHGDSDAVEHEGYGNSRMWVAMLTMASIP
jgi:hypothetical protein